MGARRPRRPRRHDDARRAQDVEQPCRGADAAAGRDSDGGPLRAAPRHRQPAVGAIARARLGRGHAAVDDLGVLRVREPGNGNAAVAHPARRRCIGTRTLHGRHARGARGERSDRLHHDVDDVGCDQRRHSVAGAQGRLHAARRRQDRHDERLSRRVVHRLHAAPGRRCVDWVRHAEDDHRQRLCRRACGAAVGTLHGGRHASGRTRSVHHAGDSSSRNGRQAERPVAHRRLPRRHRL